MKNFFCFFYLNNWFASSFILNLLLRARASVCACIFWMWVFDCIYAHTLQEEYVKWGSNKLLAHKFYDLTTKLLYFVDFIIFLVICPTDKFGVRMCRYNKCGRVCSWWYYIHYTYKYYSTIEYTFYPSKIVICAKPMTDFLNTLTYWLLQFFFSFILFINFIFIFLHKHVYAHTHT